MRIPLALAVTLSAGLVPLSPRAQSFSDNYPAASPGAAPAATFARFGPFAVSEPAAARGGSASRACLTAQTRAVLAQLEGRFGPVRVISTCRPGAVIAGSGRPSMHRYGRAVDFVPPPGRRAPMMAFLRGNAGGAVIAYRSGHVHFDTGGYSRASYAGARHSSAWR